MKTKLKPSVAEKGCDASYHNDDDDDNDDDDNDNDDNDNTTTTQRQHNEDDGDDGEDKDSIHEPKLLTYYARMSEILEITACHYGVLSRSLSRAYVMGNGFRDTCISKEEKGTAIRLAGRYNCSH
ncbi:hypothetical protein V1478_010700 [Vespula squamosa]|uniref:Uncharacterized protein n=1 Tax=Vespula squamosa TaxID=30214 RepID=A0ABD2AIH2_VESSQ